MPILNALNESDVIRLHGSADNYSLQSSKIGTSIFYAAEGQSQELIGVVSDTKDLQLDDDAFEFASV